jgi:hypothetical protein
MPLMTLGRGTLLVRDGAIGTTVACCCDCGVGQVNVMAWYWYVEDKVEVGKEQDYYQDVLDEWDKLLHGFALRGVFWIGNPSESADPVTGKVYYQEFQIWAVVQCCPDRSCDDVYYQNSVESWTAGWERIRDITLPQFDWDPNWAIGGCVGETISNDNGLNILYDCVSQILSRPNDPAVAEWVYRKSIEVCCD